MTAPTGLDASRPVRFNPFDPAFRADPYPQYRMLRERAPVHRTLGMWVLTRHADVTAVLRDRTTSVRIVPELADRQFARLTRDAPDVATPEALARIARLARTSLVFTDDPEHARLRALAGRVFGPRTVAGLRPRIRAAARRLAAPLWTEGGLDAATALAAPLPQAVLADALALPTDLRAPVGSWTHQVRYLLEPGLLDGPALGGTADAVAAFAGALSGLVVRRRADPGDDLVSALAHASTPDGATLADEELVFLVMMTFVAGVETSAALVGNALDALLDHPDQAALLRREPARIPQAVAELLRFDSPLQLTKRRTTRDTPVGGTVIPAGAQVLLCLGAANRDPEVVAAPDVLDVTRPPAAHLAFGRGMHGCLGAALASAVAEEALAVLLTGPAPVRRGPGAVRRQQHSQIVRGVSSLPVAAR